MRKVVIGLVFLMGSVTVSADELSCDTLSSLAKDVMRNRQANIPISEMMKATQGLDIAQLLIRAAYDEPRYGSEKYRQNAITDFENTWYMNCLKSKQ